MKHFLCALWLTSAVVAAAQEPSPNHDDLTSLSVDDLLNVEVTSVARRGQRLSETSAATFVITQDDIRRSSATTIPDLLRMVPGFDVAQINRNAWAVSARGFNGRWADKLLVMIDGRSVYSQMFDGVFWSLQDLPFSDIERIEVTRGPGGTLWGANAINGIVNIVTKHPIDTQGTSASVSAGEGSGVLADARHGGRFGETGHYRVYAKTRQQASTIDLTRGSYNDAWGLITTGFRTEWLTRAGVMNLQGRLQSSHTNELTNYVTRRDAFSTRTPEHYDSDAESMLFRWTANPSRRSETIFQTYYSRLHQASNVLNGSSITQTVDADFQRNVTLREGNVLTWGVEARATQYDSTTFGTMNLNLPANVVWSQTAFVQEELKLTPRFRVTAGTKILHDDASRLQWQPTLRALWTPRANQSVWAAVTRAVRLPSQSEYSSDIIVARFPGEDGTPVVVNLRGNRDLEPESVISYEAGYRVRPTSSLSIDVTAFHNSLRHITGLANGQPEIVGGETILPIDIINNLEGSTHGLEGTLTLRPSSRWDLTGGFAWWMADLRELRDPSAVPSPDVYCPRRQFQLRSFFTLTPQLEVDAAAYYVSAIREQHVAGYTRTDLRLGWQLAPDVEFSLTGTNLTGRRHIEFNGSPEAAALAPTTRVIMGTLTWRH